MRTIHLHAGMHKTGTTLIQNTLFVNRDALGAAGVNYLDMEANHSLVLYSLFSGKAGSYHMNLRRGITPGASLERHNAALRAALEARLAASRAERFVLSAEDATALTGEELGRLAAFLGGFPGRVRVILYLRHPMPWIASMVQQGLKTWHRLETLRERPPRIEYRARLEKFIRVFGREAVEFRLYRRDQEPGWDVLDDFLGAIGCPGLAAGLERAGDGNLGLSAAAVEAVDALNRLHPFYLEDGSCNPTRAIGTVTALMNLGGPSFCFVPNEGRIDAAALAAEIDWVRRETGIALDPALGGGAEPAAPVLGAERACEIAGTVNELCLRYERAVGVRETAEAEQRKAAAEARDQRARAEALEARLQALEVERRKPSLARRLLPAPVRRLAGGGR